MLLLQSRWEAWDPAWQTWQVQFREFRDELRVVRAELRDYRDELREVMDVVRELRHDRQLDHAMQVDLAAIQQRQRQQIQLLQQKLDQVSFCFFSQGH